MWWEKGEPSLGSLLEPGLCSRWRRALGHFVLLIQKPNRLRSKVGFDGIRGRCGSCFKMHVDIVADPIGMVGLVRGMFRLLCSKTWSGFPCPAGQSPDSSAGQANPCQTAHHLSSCYAVSHAHSKPLSWLLCNPGGSLLTKYPKCGSPQ